MTARTMRSTVKPTAVAAAAEPRTTVHSSGVIARSSLLVCLSAVQHDSRLPVSHATRQNERALNVFVLKSAMNQRVPPVVLGVTSSWNAHWRLPWSAQLKLFESSAGCDAATAVPPMPAPRAAARIREVIVLRMVFSLSVGGACVCAASGGVEPLGPEVIRPASPSPYPGS